MASTFTREEFYALVWSKPMTHLAKDFGLSEVALHKVCRKHDIPNPPLGWWAKKAAGKAVRQTALPKSKGGGSDRITIAAGELRPEPELIATVRENARLLASSIDADAVLPANPIVDRTIAQLRKAKPSAQGLAAVEGANVIRASVAPATIDRLEIALNRIVAAGEALGIKLVRGEKFAAFERDGETLGFSISERLRREKHVPTEKELAEQEADRRRRARRWNNPRSLDDRAFDLSFLRGPEWDYHPTGLLGFELARLYLLDGSPRRSSGMRRSSALKTWRATLQLGSRRWRPQKRMIAQGVRSRRVSARKSVGCASSNFAGDHVAERRDKALDGVLEDLASLDRLRTDWSRIFAARRCRQPRAAFPNSSNSQSIGWPRVNSHYRRRVSSSASKSRNFLVRTTITRVDRQPTTTDLPDSLRPIDQAGVRPYDRK